MLVWVVDAGNFGCCVAYCMVAISFIILRKKEPELDRPYKVGPYRLVGALAVIMSAFMVVMYVIPGSGAALVPQEWIMVGGWSLLGVVFFAACRAKYGERFGTLVEIISEEDALTLQTSDEDLDAAITAAIDAAIAKVLSRQAEQQPV